MPWPGHGWPAYVVLASSYVMFGLLGWLGLISIAGARMVNHLLRLPQFTFDPAPIGMEEPARPLRFDANLAVFGADIEFPAEGVPETAAHFLPAFFSPSSMNSPSRWWSHRTFDS